MIRVLVVVVVVVVALTGAACTKRHDKTTDTLPPITTTTTTTIDVSKVPAAIDVPYVQAVMNSLDQLQGDAVRVFAKTKQLTPDVNDLLRALFDEPQLTRSTESYSVDAAKNVFPIKEEPGNPTTNVKNIIDSSPTCVVFQAERDYGPIFTTPKPDRDLAGVVELIRHDRGSDPAAKNRTAWSIKGEGFVADSKIPANPCV